MVEVLTKDIPVNTGTAFRCRSGRKQLIFLICGQILSSRSPQPFPTKWLQTLRMYQVHTRTNGLSNKRIMLPFNFHLPLGDLFNYKQTKKRNKGDDYHGQGLSTVDPSIEFAYCVSANEEQDPGENQEDMENTLCIVFDGGYG